MNARSPSSSSTEKLGPDALDRRFDFPAFKAAMLGVKCDVKATLMDQQIIAGIGSIFSDEILFQARIDPAARTEELTSNQLQQLFLHMREVLKTAIACGAGGCRSALKVFKVGGRTAYCCPRCQKC